MQQVVANFRIIGKPMLCEQYGHGHINNTYRVVTDKGRQYILQQINRRVFPDIKGLMDNIAAVTKFLGARVDNPRGALSLVPTLGGATYYEDPQGESWRMYDFIEDSICLETIENVEDFYESAVAFGQFQQLMASFPADMLHETIVDFHNTIDRYRKFKEAVARDSMGRAGGVQAEIQFALEREEEAGELHRLRLSGELPLRVTHNDTKINNIMMDVHTRKALCVIDLDTVMPGLVAYDFGDSIRFGAVTAAEDERDLSKVSFDIHLFEIFTKGFLSACPNITSREIETLPLGAKIMTLECGVRFLTDYLEGDCYFKIHREQHNLDRCRTQFRLVADMESKWEEMQRIVAQCREQEAADTGGALCETIWG